jgi:hypothetical protein
MPFLLTSHTYQEDWRIPGEQVTAVDSDRDKVDKDEGRRESNFREDMG